MKTRILSAMCACACLASPLSAADWARPGYATNCNCQSPAVNQSYYPPVSPPAQVTRSYAPSVTTANYAPVAPAPAYPNYPLVGSATATTCWQPVGYRCAAACRPAACCPAPTTCYAPAQTCCTPACCSKHPILDNIRERCAERKARRAERRAARCCQPCCYPTPCVP